MDDILVSALARIGAGLNMRARRAMLPLISADRRGRVERGILQIDAGELGPPSELEKRFLQQLAPPEPTEEMSEPGSGHAGEADAEEEGESAPPEAEEREGLVALLALLCACADPGVAAQFIVLLPPHLQGGIPLKIASATPLNLTRDLDREEADLAERLRGWCEGREVWGIEAACSILRTIPEPRQLRRVITIADEQNHETLTILQNHLFLFEDLLRLSDRDLQTLMLQVDNAELAQALQMTAERVKKRLLANISQRRVRMIAEEEERYAHATMAEIEQAQMGILNLTRHLYEQGKIFTYFGSVEKREPVPAGGVQEEEEEQQESARKEVAGAKGGKRSLLLIGGIVLLGAVVVGWLLQDAVQSGRKATVKTGIQRRGGRNGTMRVLVRGEEDEVAGDRGGGGGKVGSGASLAAGESMKTPEGARAVLEFPGRGLFELEEMGEVDRPEESDGEGEGELYLRVGRTRTTVLQDEFEVRTPVVRVVGRPGAVFRTRVVLDASTVVEVERGQVEIAAMDGEGTWLLKGGERGVFDPRGGVDIGRWQVTESDDR